MYKEGMKGAEALAESPELAGKKAKPVPKSSPEIGMDTDDGFVNALLAMADSSQVDLGTFDNFGSTSQARESIYSLIDTMAQDDRVSAVLETYAEDVTDANEGGQIVWCESSDANVGKYVARLIDELNVDKHIYEWAYSLCKYGDAYLRLYRESDYGSDPVFSKAKRERGSLNESAGAKNESILVTVPEANDRYVHYVELVSNPAEMFELTKFGKTVGYIKAPVLVQNHGDYSMLNSAFLTYSLNRGDINVYGATDFVHASLSSNNAARVPEEVEIFQGEGEGKTSSGTYSVRKGQSLLYNEFRIWRELSLMENTVLLNRITKSALTRILQIEVGDMPDYKVKAVMDFIKSKLEQKTALEVGKSIQEYTNPGPVENIIYVPTHGGQGAISAQTIGGDYDPKTLTDLDYFLDKFYGGLRVPKQYFGCLRGDTPITLLDGTTHSIREMYENSQIFIGKGIMACDVDGKLVPTRISEVLLTKPEATFLRIHLDNGEYVDVTEDHRMMLRDGTFVFAKDIKEGDSLMPYYERMNEDGRKEVLDNKEGKYRLQYRVVAESKFDDIPKTNNIHHTDCNKLNDDFDNLEKLKYVPEVNNKVIGIENLDVIEPAYDINVEDSCHTFALPCGIFVHNCTDDSTGFNGGTSLSIISSRYGKAVKRIQNSLCQMVTDLVNILLLDSGLDDYVNKFTIRMQPPITQEELDRRENMRNRMGVMNDVMSQVDSIVTDDVIKAKIAKSLLSQVVTDPEVIDLIQEQIDKAEAEAEAEEGKGAEEGDGKAERGGSPEAEPPSAKEDALDDFGASMGFGGEPETGEGPAQEPEPTSGEGEDSFLPSPEDLGVDLTGSGE